MNYADKITEELTFLQLTEKQQTKANSRDYVRFLRLLKSAECTTQQAAASQVNFSLRQAQRLWKTYQQEGMMSSNRKLDWKTLILKRSKRMSNGAWNDFDWLRINQLRQA